MWYISTKWLWIPVYAWMLYILFKRFKEDHFLWLLFLIATCVLINDQVASSLFKNWIGRLRPSHEPMLQGLVHLVNGPNGQLYKGGTFGFYSSHAANLAGVVTMFIVLIKPKGLLMALPLAMVVLVSYSRIYLGVHYPTDILIGWLMGTGVGLVHVWIFRHWVQRAQKTG